MKKIPASVDLNVRYDLSYKKHAAIENALEYEFIEQEEYDACKEMLDEHYYQPKGLVQFVYDYMRNNNVPYVQFDKEAFKNAFAEMVEQQWIFINRR